MDKLEAVQRVLRFSNTVREWCEGENKTYFDDFDSENVKNYEEGGYAALADEIIDRGIEEGFIDAEDIE